MKAEYFTRRHVNLLNNWNGKKRDVSDVQQEQAYQELKNAYEIVEEWAHGLQQKAFPKGCVKLRKGPVNQGGHFFSYLWAKIYPTQNAPTSLAYTVHISIDDIAVKIDTVNAQPSLVEKYNQIRGEYSNSPIVRSLSIEQGLSMTLEQLIQWSVDAVNEFQLSYDEVADKLNLLVQIQEPTQSNKAITGSRNVIYYGPPGTGKTYLLQQKQAEYTSSPEVVDDSMWLQEKIAPLNWMQVLVLSLLSLGKQAKVSDIVSSQYFQIKAKLNNRDNNLSQTAWSYLQKFTIADSTTVNYKGRNEPAVFDKSSDSIWKLVDSKLELVEDLVTLHQELEQGPQSGTEIKRYTTTTFHQSYGYEEFIEGVKASTDDDGNINYSIEAGEFLKLCRRAEQDSTHQYAIFIDEINRGNISKIFGELISLVEVDKRSDGKHPMSINLAYSGKPFTVPSNVDIIGTMNTADRSLALMDTALRRRFEFIEMMPDSGKFKSGNLIDSGDGKSIDLARLLDTLNARIEALYDREHTLGHAFFFPACNAVKEGNHALALQELQSAFKRKVIPLLQEYFYDDWSKIRLVLGDNQKLDKQGSAVGELQFIHKKNFEYDKLFGSSDESDNFASDEYRYELADDKHEVWGNGLAYIAIYDPTVAKGDKKQLSEAQVQNEGA